MRQVLLSGRATTTRAFSLSSKTSSIDKSASSYLHQQSLLEERENAELEEKDRRSTTTPDIPELRERAWDGDEPQDRAIRRILEDSYKPLRIKGWKKEIPVPAPLPNYLFDPPPHQVQGQSDPEWQANQVHKEGDSEQRPKHPWEYTFKSPTRPDSSPSVRRNGQTLVLPSLTVPKLKPLERTKRLAQALEKTRDYEAGVRASATAHAHAGQQGRRSMGAINGWAALVEDRIDQARKNGMFKTSRLKGRPIPQDPAERNPFIPRHEFLINRIVQSQGAAPPWVELQAEYETELALFRSTLRQAWVRRTVRTLALGGVSRTSIATALSDTYRDKEWEARERAYHEKAIDVLNATLRKYNVQAPYHVRKPPIKLEAELAKCFEDSKGVIAAELQRRFEGRPRADAASSSSLEGVLEEENDERGQVADKEVEAVDESMWKGFRRLVGQLVGNGPLMVEYPQTLAQTQQTRRKV